MLPDPDLKRADFSKSVMVTRSGVGNFPEGNLTISFWIKFKRVSFDTSNHRLIVYNDVSSSDHPNRGGGYHLIIADPQRLTISLSGITGSTGASVNDDQWHHVAVTLARDANAPNKTGHFTIYRDGEQAGSWTVPDGYETTLMAGGPLQVQFPFQEFDGDGNLADRYMDGLGSMAEVRVWNEVRSQKQIKVEMTGYLGRHGDKLLLHWPIGFSGGITPTVPDASGNNNDGNFVATIERPKWISDPIPWKPAPKDLKGIALAKADIAGLPLAECDLTGASLQQAKLDGVDLTSANLTGADMSQASLPGAIFTDAGFYGTNLTGTDLTTATFSQQPKWGISTAAPTILEGATIALTSLGHSWSNLRLTGANLVGLGPGSDLTNIIADHIVFQRAPMQGVSAKGANFSSADLSGAQLNDADLTNCTLNGAIFYGADLSGATLANANLTDARLGGIGNDPTKSSAVLSHAYMPGVTLTRAELYGVDLSYAQIYGGARLDLAHLEAANLSNANLCTMDFSQAHMKGVVLSGAALVHCKFLGVDLSPTAGGAGTSFSNANLQGADFTGANLDGVNFDCAVFALEKGTLKVDRIDKFGRDEKAEEPYSPTVIQMGAGNASTTWPDGYRRPLTDMSQLKPRDPPPAPECVPSLTSFCPRHRRAG